MTRTRIAPSPTGEDLHIGNLYTAFFNWTWAKKHKGQFIVRIEDTDRTRLVAGSEERILKTLDAFGLSPDEKPLRQSERLEIYKQHAEELINLGAAYYCFCSRERLDELRKKQQAEKKVPKYDKYCLKNLKSSSPAGGLNLKPKPHVIRLNVPENRAITFHDEIHGDITFNSNDIDDQVLLKSDGFPTYHLAVVVDDYLMKISHVIRAEEWISSTPKHILLYEAFGWELPFFAHLPILRNPDKSKLSKRKNPVWASWYLQEGFLPEAILNYLALMGWSHPEQKEIFTIEEFIKVFELKDIQPVGPVFDLQKLRWMNMQYMMKIDISKYRALVSTASEYKPDNTVFTSHYPLIRERIKTFKEYDEIAGFFFKPPKEYEIDLKKYKNELKKVAEALSAISNWTADKIGEVMQKTAGDLGMKNSEFFMMLRIAITGKKITPPLNESMEILGKAECLERIKVLL